jgi:hypothetical protein
MSNEFWTEFESLLDKSEPESIEYRLHYTDGGDIYACTMQQHPENTNYVVVIKPEYDKYFEYAVVEGKLKRIVSDSGYHVQLQKSDRGFKTVKGHASLLIEDEEYTEVEYYEYRNH